MPLIQAVSGRLAAKTLCGLLLLFFAGTGLAGAQSNGWITSGGGKWETSGNWSLSMAPGAGQSLLITNATDKTVTIDAVTAGLPATLTVSNVTIDSPLFTFNALYLDGAGATPLQVLGTLTIGEEAALFLTGSIVRASSLINSGVIEADNSTLVLAANSGTVTLTGSILLTNGSVLLSVGPGNVTIATDVQYGGGVSGGSIISSNGGSVSSLFLADPVFRDNDGTMLVMGGNDINYGQIGSDMTNTFVMGGTGTFTGVFGGNNNGILNEGTLMSMPGGTLTLDPRDAFDYGGVQNGSNGTMVVATNSTLAISRTANAWTNAFANFPVNNGTVSLQTGTLLGQDSTGPTGHYVNNALVDGCGTISGFTTVINSGTILANCGGSLTFAGIVTNTGSIFATDGTHITFSGAVVNNGTINATQGLVTFLSTYSGSGVLVTNGIAVTVNTVYDFGFSLVYRLTQGNDGNFYGASFWGGGTDPCVSYGECGFVFQLTPAGGFTELHHFLSGTDGYHPSGPVVQGTDGNFYGGTAAGGLNGTGTLYQITTAGTLTTLHNFDVTDGTYCVQLIQGTNGLFYGTTPGVGSNGVGSVFQITSAGTFTSLYQFTGGADGNDPNGPLVMGPGGFYGTANQGGSNGFGTVFAFNPPNSLATLYTFTGGIDGASPPCPLTRGFDGNFYGMTSSNTSGGFGTVFRITPAGTLTTVYTFNGSEGANQSYGLIQGSDNNFYGSPFRLTSQGTLTVLHVPIGPMLQAVNGNFYNTANNSAYEFTLPLASAANQVTAMQISGTNALVTLASVESETDQLQVRASLTSGSWSNVPGASVTNGIGGSLTLTNFGGASAPQQFYRLAITP